MWLLETPSHPPHADIAGSKLEVMAINQQDTMESDKAGNSAVRVDMNSSAPLLLYKYLSMHQLASVLIQHILLSIFFVGYYGCSSIV